MKLSELVNFYNRLCAFSVNDVQTTAIHQLTNITSTADDPELNVLQKSVQSAFDQFDSRLDAVKQQIMTQIQDDGKVYLQNSYSAYEEEQSYVHERFNLTIPEPPPKIRQREYEIRDRRIQDQVEKLLRNQLDISDDGRSLLQVRIQRHSTWQHSAMIIHPGRESWVDLMVGNDPLYIVDQHHDLLKPTMSRFNEVYQRRLRPYVIQETLDQEILTQIPNNQFGLILVYGYFDYKPFEVIQKYLSELYNKTRPGGTVLMTFNDCDRWPAVLASEVSVMRYTPGWMVRDWAQVLGFEIEFDWNENGTWSWLELRKPGEFRTLRGGQALAKILPK